MADVKISALPAATLPLAGTEVLPIVQGTSTVKVTNNDLRPKQIQSNTTSGVLQITGPAAASTRVMTTPNADFTAARTDAAQSFSGNQGLLDGNLVIGTSGKGIDFSATPDATATSELFADYEEGTFTPTIIGTTGAGTATYASQKGIYTKIGNVVYISIAINWSSGNGTGNFRISGLPYTTRNDSALYNSFAIGIQNNVTLPANNYLGVISLPNTTSLAFYSLVSGGGATAALAYDASGEIEVSGFYFV